MNDVAMSYYHLCPRCRQETFGPGACEACAAMPLANVLLDPPAAASTGPEPTPVCLLEAWAYAVGVMAVLSYLVWETRSFWVGLVEIWFGGK